MIAEAEPQTTSLLSTNPRDFFVKESYVAFTVMTRTEG
jgi:hypothetical protein